MAATDHGEGVMEGEGGGARDPKVMVSLPALMRSGSTSESSGKGAHAEGGRFRIGG